MNNGTGTGTEYLKAAEAAELLRVSPKTVSRWAKEGRIRHITTLGGHRRFPRDEVERIAGLLTRSLGQADGVPTAEAAGMT